jgi:hypothetical protein
MKDIVLAEDIISEIMADEEMRLRQALENKYFYSVILLNKCRKFFVMNPEEPIDKTKCKNFVSKGTTVGKIFSITE